jgi:1-acyl-sn-glycerol-3-phosphate acyltransferase
VQAVLYAPLLLLPERYIWPACKFWARSCLFLHRVITGTAEDLRGLERIPSGGLLIAAKHQSAWETLRLTLMVPRPTFILKRQLLYVPLFGWYMWKTGMIPVDRGKGGAAIDAMTTIAKRRIAEGRQIIIFPEGTRRAPGAPPIYRRGPARLYAALGVPCLPVALNSGLFWPRRAWHRRGTILLECLDPIAPGLDPDKFGRLLEARIEAATDALKAESAARDPSLLPLAAEQRTMAGLAD